ncbi:MAG: hypothetical protein ACTHOJ_18085 [Sphingomonas oligoaromativorans]
MMPQAYRNIAGTWRSAICWRNIAGTWKRCNVWRNIAGTWKLVGPYFSLTTDRANILINGFIQSQTATITSIVGSTTWTFTLIAGSASARITLGPTSGASTTISCSTPASGNGTVTATYRITAANGDFIDIPISANWGIS